MPKQSKLQKLREIARRGSQAAVEQAQARARAEKQRARQRIQQTDRQDVRRAIRKAGMTIDVNDEGRRTPPEKSPEQRARETATMAPPTPARFNPTSNPEKLHLMAGGGGIGQPLDLGNGGDQSSQQRSEPAVSPLGTGTSDGPRMDEMVAGPSNSDREQERDDVDPLAMDGDLLGFGGDGR